jgi:transketolase
MTSGSPRPAVAADTALMRRHAAAAREVILVQSKRAHVGHVGSALSVVDILATLYGGAMRVIPADDERDRFILSKGHAALALYAILFLNGVLSAQQLEAYCADGTLLGVHPEKGLPGIDFSSGSLGHGLSLGAGAALAGRLRRSGRRAFVLLSDAELNEGSVWEAVMFAAHHRLGNLLAIVDVNGQQALGYTADVLNLTPLGERFRAFGWDVSEVAGHDVEALAPAFTVDAAAAAPRVVLAHTVFGRGVPFMERRIEWHYLPMSDQQYRRALDAVRAEGDGTATP